MKPIYAKVTPKMGWKLPSSLATAIKKGRTRILLAIIGKRNIKHIVTNKITITNKKIVKSPVTLPAPNSIIFPIVLDSL